MPRGATAGGCEEGGGINVNRPRQLLLALSQRLQGCRVWLPSCVKQPRDGEELHGPGLLLLPFLRPAAGLLRRLPSCRNHCRQQYLPCQLVKQPSKLPHHTNVVCSAMARRHRHQQVVRHCDTTVLRLLRLLPLLCTPFAHAASAAAAPLVLRRHMAQHEVCACQQQGKGSDQVRLGRQQRCARCAEQLPEEAQGGAWVAAVGRQDEVLVEQILQCGGGRGPGEGPYRLSQLGAAG